MKALAAVLATLLLVAICSCTASFPKADIDMAHCCFTYSKAFIRPKMITSVYRTSSSCPLPAVVLVTKRGMQICVDPEAHWVQKYLRDIETVQE